MVAPGKKLTSADRKKYALLAEKIGDAAVARMVGRKKETVASWRYEFGIILPVSTNSVDNLGAANDHLISTAAAVVKEPYSHIDSGTDMNATDTAKNNVPHVNGKYWNNASAAHARREWIGSTDAALELCEQLEEALLNSKMMSKTKLQDTKSQRMNAVRSVLNQMADAAYIAGGGVLEDRQLSGLESSTTVWSAEKQLAIETAWSARQHGKIDEPQDKFSYPWDFPRKVIPQWEKAVNQRLKDEGIKVETQLAQHRCESFPNGHLLESSMDADDAIRVRLGCAVTVAYDNTNNIPDAGRVMPSKDSPSGLNDTAYIKISNNKLNTDMLLICETKELETGNWGHHLRLSAEVECLNGTQDKLYKGLEEVVYSTNEPQPQQNIASLEQAMNEHDAKLTEFRQIVPEKFMPEKVIA